MDKKKNSPTTFTGKMSLFKDAALIAFFVAGAVLLVQSTVFVNRLDKLTSFTVQTVERLQNGQ